MGRRQNTRFQGHHALQLLDPETWCARRRPQGTPSPIKVCPGSENTQAETLQSSKAVAGKSKEKGGAPFPPGRCFAYHPKDDVESYCETKSEGKKWDSRHEAQQRRRKRSELVTFRPQHVWLK